MDIIWQYTEWWQLVELVPFTDILLPRRLEVFSNVWRQRPGSASEGRPDSFSRHLQRLSNHLSTPVLEYEEKAGVRRFWFVGLAVAASLVLVVAMVWVLRPGHGAAAADGYNTVSTRPGSRSKIQLPDGTLVWLNADSRLRYKVGEGGNREVQLTGEAYFDVARDKNHPFLIHTPTVNIRVLGTSFDVRSYGNEKNTETSLFEGSVEVSLSNNPERKIVLRPHEKLIVHNDELAVTGIEDSVSGNHYEEPALTLGTVHYQQKDSSYMEMLWTRNQLAFDDRTLEEVALQLERWYGVKVSFTDERLKQERFSGVFEDESLAQVMEALQITGGFHYTIKGNQVTIND